VHAKGLVPAVAVILFLVGCARTGAVPPSAGSHRQALNPAGYIAGIGRAAPPPAGRHGPGSPAGPSTSAAASRSVAPSTPSRTAPVLPNWVDMISPTTGWGLAAGAVLRTLDGGATWTNVSPPGDLSRVGTGGRGGAAFLNASDAWIPVVSPVAAAHGHPVTVERTGDGGRTWSATTLPAGTSGGARLSFVTATQGWAWVGFGAATAQESSEVLGTTDGGRRWTPLAAPFSPYTVPPGGSVGKGYPGSCCLLTFGFSSATTGWLGGWMFAPGTALWQTADGGTTWKQRPLTLKPEVAARAGGGNETVSTPVFHGPDGALCVQVSAAASSYLVQMFSSSDGGATWQGGAALQDKSGCSGNWGFPSPGHLWIAGAAHLDTSADSGASWQTVTPPGLPLPAVKDIDFLTAADGWAVTGGAVLRTTDGGAAWTVIAGALSG
jgi:photosystem II stability/assembly factor-like uncharacterized protein